jgi:hypothetical protein
MKSKEHRLGVQICMGWEVYISIKEENLDLLAIQCHPAALKNYYD